MQVATAPAAARATPARTAKPRAKAQARKQAKQAARKQAAAKAAGKPKALTDSRAQAHPGVATPQALGADFALTKLLASTPIHSFTPVQTRSGVAVICTAPRTTSDQSSPL